MTSKGWFLIGMLAILFLANLGMLMGLTNWPQQTREGFAAAFVAGKTKTKEGFSDYLVTADGSAFATAPIGMYDGLNVAAGLPGAAQGFRQNHPNEPLAGPAIEIGPENLFVFKNNQCKPECCGATLSCSGGCVCSTPAQRDLIANRGGNRLHDEGF